MGKEPVKARAIEHLVTDGAISRFAFPRDLGQQGFVGIDVIENDDFSFRRMEPVQAARILCERSTPRNGHG